MFAYLFNRHPSNHGISGELKPRILNTLGSGLLLLRTKWTRWVLVYSSQTVLVALTLCIVE